MDISTREKLELEFLELTKNLKFRYTLTLFICNYEAKDGYFKDESAKNRFLNYLKPIDGIKMFDFSEVTNVNEKHNIYSCIIKIVLPLND
jgi:hypothetical protein